MTAVRLQHISKRFGDTVALADINFEVVAGELFFLLGPSGCGKSTLLRLIAGFHEPSAGQIFFNGQDVTAADTEHRNAVMCFQSYALWPHMTVAENVRFGLSVRGVGRAVQQERVGQVLKLVQMEAFAGRKPNQLSGGQQQRVALARALAVNPAVLLLDEPLSNLDTKLRQEMRGEIRRICKTANITTIYVTHDQKEALSVADRIAVLKDGKLIQLGSPGDLYQRPVNSFVADFLGPTNLIPGTVIARRPRAVEVETPAGVITADTGGAATPGKVILSIRPDRIRLVNPQQFSPANDTNRMNGTVKESTFLGESSEIVLQVNAVRLKMFCSPPIWQVPPTMTVEFAAADVVVLAE